MPGEVIKDVVQFTGKAIVRGQALTDRLAKHTVLQLVKPVNLTNHREAE